MLRGFRQQSGLSGFALILKLNAKTNATANTVISIIFFIDFTSLFKNIVYKYY
jgi:hypothetical protein